MRDMIIFLKLIDKKRLKFLLISFAFTYAVYLFFESNNLFNTQDGLWNIGGTLIVDEGAIA